MDDMGDYEAHAGSWTEESFMGTLVWHTFYHLGPSGEVNRPPTGSMLTVQHPTIESAKEDR
jgi:hypothetical protein